jgi:hypothetical protein
MDELLTTFFLKLKKSAKISYYKPRHELLTTYYIKKIINGDAL